jgi:hypothetical protein
MFNRLQLPALVFTLLLLALISMLRGDRVAAGPAAADPTTTSAPALSPLHMLAPLDDFMVSVERTLFTLDRRLPQPLPAAAVAPAPSKPPVAVTPPRLTLAATIREGKHQVAIVSTLAPPSTLELELGDTVDGWTVESIAIDRVTLARGMARHQLLLRPYAKNQ